MSRIAAVACLVLAASAAPLRAAPTAVQGAAAPAQAVDPVAAVGRLLAAMNPGTESVHELTAKEAKDFFGLAASLEANVFELFDYAYRYLAPRGSRVAVPGGPLREAAKELVLGDKRVYAILPVDRASRIELGAARSPGQGALDVVLEGPYTSYIEIGTAVIAARFGFKEMAPKAFLSPYGIKVRRLVFETALERLELYAPRKMAIYVEGLERPKKWNIVAVRSR